ELMGDIELFAHAASAPVVAVTGSNGKTTVTTLLGEMLNAAGVRVEVGGNIGVPALELLSRPVPDYYLLELSSFQLETVSSLNAVAAVVLNLSADHLDRHLSLQQYSELKAKIFQGDGVVVFNRDDPLVVQQVLLSEVSRQRISFGLSASLSAAAWGVEKFAAKEWLVRGGEQVVAISSLAMSGRHNIANIAAAFALADALGVNSRDAWQAMAAVAISFKGLPHRLQHVTTLHGVEWYNDSKGTNVGATVAAINGMTEEKMVLLAGGVGKGADFSPLEPVVNERCRAVLLFGVDGPLLQQALGNTIPIERVETLDEAVKRAAELALPGDAVLLSPACASFDQYKNYSERGDHFQKLVVRMGMGYAAY
ncbi:MAG: UDP-N-acetylmuramoyl-L-alanine--D-glutamate ligase, partial [Gammaproteobacteria bacterium]|nr:UDP-N-acetylmuramoyl-L-alanine--D-glutamate ligase [Gammaproteobacteria bacterium]